MQQVFVIGWVLLCCLVTSIVCQEEGDSRLGNNVTNDDTNTRKQPQQSNHTFEHHSQEEAEVGELEPDNDDVEEVNFRRLFRVFAQRGFPFQVQIPLESIYRPAFPADTNGDPFAWLLQDAANTLRMDRRPLVTIRVVSKLPSWIHFRPLRHELYGTVPSELQQTRTFRIRLEVMATPLLRRLARQQGVLEVWGVGEVQWVSVWLTVRPTNQPPMLMFPLDGQGYPPVRLLLNGTTPTKEDSSIVTARFSPSTFVDWNGDAFLLHAATSANGSRALPPWIEFLPTSFAFQVRPPSPRSPEWMQLLNGDSPTLVPFPASNEERQGGKVLPRYFLPLYVHATDGFGSRSVSSFSLPIVVVDVADPVGPLPVISSPLQFTVVDVHVGEPLRIPFQVLFGVMSVQLYRVDGPRLSKELGVDQTWLFLDGNQLKGIPTSLDLGVWRVVLSASNGYHSGFASASPDQGDLSGNWLGAGSSVITLDVRVLYPRSLSTNATTLEKYPDYTPVVRMEQLGGNNATTFKKKGSRGYLEVSLDHLWDTTMDLEVRPLNVTGGPFAPWLNVDYDPASRATVAWGYPPENETLVSFKLWLSAHVLGNASLSTRANITFLAHNRTLPSIKGLPRTTRTEMNADFRMPLGIFEMETFDGQDADMSVLIANNGTWLKYSTKTKTLYGRPNSQERQNVTVVLTDSTGAVNAYRMAVLVEPESGNMQSDTVTVPISLLVILFVLIGVLVLSSILICCGYRRFANAKREQEMKDRQRTWMESGFRRSLFYMLDPPPGKSYLGAYLRFVFLCGRDERKYGKDGATSDKDQQQVVINMTPITNRTAVIRSSAVDHADPYSNEKSSSTHLSDTCEFTEINLNEDGSELRRQQFYTATSLDDPSGLKVPPFGNTTGHVLDSQITVKTTAGNAFHYLFPVCLLVGEAMADKMGFAKYTHETDPHESSISGNYMNEVLSQRIIGWIGDSKFSTVTSIMSKMGGDDQANDLHEAMYEEMSQRQSRNLSLAGRNSSPFSLTSTMRSEPYARRPDTRISGDSSQSHLGSASLPVAPAISFSAHQYPSQDALPPWLHFNPRRCSFFGIPTSLDRGTWWIEVRVQHGKQHKQLGGAVLDRFTFSQQKKPAGEMPQSILFLLEVE